MNAGSSATAGGSDGSSGTGDKVFNFGTNPNLASSNITTMLSNPYVIGGFIVAYFVYKKFK